MNELGAAVNRKKVRTGLVVIGLIFVASVALASTLEGPVGRAVFGFVGFVCVVRMLLLARWLWRGRPDSLDR